jgi:hypothetical protein
MHSQQRTLLMSIASYPSLTMALHFDLSNLDSLEYILKSKPNVILQTMQVIDRTIQIIQYMNIPLPIFTNP